LLCAACLVALVAAVVVTAVVCVSQRADPLQTCYEWIEVGIDFNQARAMLEVQHRLTHVDSTGNASEAVWIYQDALGTSALSVTVRNDGIVTGSEIIPHYGKLNSSFQRVATFLGLP
jgi:hypothetical protein